MYYGRKPHELVEAGRPIRKPEIKILQTTRQFSESVIDQVEKGRAGIRERAEKSTIRINDLTIKRHHGHHKCSVCNKGDKVIIRIRQRGKIQLVKQDIYEGTVVKKMEGQNSKYKVRYISDNGKSAQFVWLTVEDVADCYLPKKDKKAEQKRKQKDHRKGMLTGPNLDLFAFDNRMLPPFAKIMQNFILMQNTWKGD